MQQAQRADGAVPHHSLRLANHGVAAVGEGDGPMEPALGSQRLQAAGIGQVERQGFLDHDVLALQQRALREVHVAVVGRADVDHVDVGIAEDLLGIGGCVRDAQRRRPHLCPLRVGAHQPGDIRIAGTPDRIHVERSHEPGADDCRPQPPPLNHVGDGSRTPWRPRRSRAICIG